MRNATILLLIGALLAAAAPRAAGETKTDSAPSVVKDICKDCVDPYVPTAERGRFFKVAGKDNEIDAGEFDAGKAAGGGFVRKFDTWSGMLAFDKNSNKTLDWFEADAYRNDIRRRVLAAFDSDKDKKLLGKERQAANRTLAAGKVPGAAGRAGAAGGAVWRRGQMSEAMRLRMFDKNRDGKLDTDEKAAADKWLADSEKRRKEYAVRAERWRKLNDELRKKHDIDGDGKLDADERKAYYEEYRQRAKIVQWDADGDGKLSDAERKEMETKQAEWKKRAEESRRKWMLQRWDKDKDGKLSEEELAAQKTYQDERKKRTEQAQKEQAELRDKHDADGDGKLDADERKTYYKAVQEKWRIRRWDKNSDGKLDDAERKAMEAQQSKQPYRSNMLINGRQISPVQGGVTVRQAGHGPAAGTIIIQRGKTNKRDKE
jgi:Ca2+-binding EF-hand superfamily protein